MAKTLALLVGAVTRTLTLDSVSSAGFSTYTEKTGPLVGRLKLVARIKPNAAGTVLRTSLKLSESQVTQIAPPDGDGIPRVAYEQVWSHDVSVVMGSSQEKRESLVDLTKALVSNADVKSMVVNGSDIAV